MIFIPAIDIRGGKVVRLITGAFELEMEYGTDPVAFAKEFEKEGAEWVHVVDLDGALGGSLRNIDQLKKIRDNTKLKIEFGGGLRSSEAIDSVLEMGIDRVILGTKGLEEDFLKAILARHGEKVAVSLDAKQGIVQVQGWTETSNLATDEFLERLKKLILRYLVYTNIAKDGTLEGPDIAGLREILKHAGNIKVILSGGVSSLEDLDKIARLKHGNLYGVIVGRALYENKISVGEALRFLVTRAK